MRFLFRIAFLATCSFAISFTDCPRFVEFLPDPLDTADALGEFIELRLPDSINAYDTLYVRMEEKASMAFSSLHGNRILLHRDTLQCPPLEYVDCRVLVTAALPNSRSVYWTLSFNACKDSVILPVPKAGKSLQWNDFLQTWEYTTPTPGYPNAEFESAISDCGLEFLFSKYENGAYHVGLALFNCDKAMVYYETETFDLSSRRLRDSVFVEKNALIKIPSKGIPERFMAHVEKDEVPQNDSLDTLLISNAHSPLRFTEIHYCPSEGGEEWVEVYNALPRALPLQGISFCARGKAYVDADSIGAYESILFTKDTLSLRMEIGFFDVRIFRASFGALKNAGDTLALCYGDDTLNVTTWSKEMSKVCPNGFNPQSGLRENTPGFQGRMQKTSEKSGSAPFSVELSERTVSKRKKNPVRVKITGSVTVCIVLLAESGRVLYESNVFADDANWVEIPVWKENTGVYFLKFSAGRYEKTHGIIVRP